MDFHMADKPCPIDTVLKWCDEKTYLWDITTGGGLPAEELEEKVFMWNILLPFLEEY